MSDHVHDFDARGDCICGESNGGWPADRPTTEPRTEAGKALDRLDEIAPTLWQQQPKGHPMMPMQIIIREWVATIRSALAEAAHWAAPRAEGLPDDRTCLTHPRQVPHDWHHQSYEGTWLCHCTVCGIVPNRAAPRAEGLGDYANPEVRQAAREKINGAASVSQWFAGQLLDVIERVAEGAAPRAEGLDVERLARAMAIWSDPDADEAEIDLDAAFYETSARETADIYARLSRPSDEREGAEHDR